MIMPIDSNHLDVQFCRTLNEICILIIGKMHFQSPNDVKSISALYFINKFSKEGIILQIHNTIVQISTKMLIL